MFTARLIPLFLILFFPAKLFAQEADTTVALPEIEVTDNRLPVSTLKSAARVTTVRIDEESGVSGLDRLLLLTGIAVRSYGPGGLASVSVRGGTSSQLAVVYDGIQLVNPQLGEFDLSLLATGGVDAVQLVHGPASSWLGGHGASGVLAISRNRQARNGLSGTATAGSFGSRSVSVGGNILTGGALVNGTFSYRESDGNFKYLDNTRFPAEYVRRQNAAVETADLKLSGDFGGALPSMGILITTTNRELPGNAGSAATGAAQYDDHLVVYANKVYSGSQMDGTTKASVQRYRLRYVNDAQEIDDTGNTTAVTLEQTVSGGRGHFRFVGGIFGSRLAAVHPSLHGNAVEWSGAAYAISTFENRQMTWTNSFRYDHYALSDDDRWHFLNPRTGVNVRLVPNGRLRLKASAGRSASVPTFNDRFWSGAGAIGNRDLRPEHGWTVDAGVVAAMGPLTLETTSYLSRTTDQIEWRSTANNLWTPGNIGTVVSRGLENRMQFRGQFDGIRLMADATYNVTIAEDRTEPANATYGKQLRYVPKHSVGLRLSAARGHNNLLIDGHAAGTRYVTADERTPLPGYLVTNLEIRREIVINRTRATISGSVNNLFNIDYVMVQGYPMPLRHYGIGIFFEI